MKTKIGVRFPATIISSLALIVLLSGVPAFGGSWSGIDPLHSTREDVEKVLGKPIGEAAPDGSLRFTVAGGVVTVFFVSPRFVELKKLNPKVIGTVLEIVLQHDRSSDTPESLGLMGKKNFTAATDKNTTVYRDLTDGVAYTFIEGKLRTTRYSASNDQLMRSRK